MWCSDPPHRRRRIGRVLILLVALSFGQAARAQGVVLVSARAGGIPELDRETAAQLYLGRRTSLPDGRSARLLDLPAGPERDLFYERLTAKNPSQIRAYWSRLVFTGRAQPPREASSVDEARRLVLESQGSIAYLPRTAANDPGLQILFILE